MSTTQLYDQLNDLWETFQENHRKFTDKGNKAAATRARKSIGEIKKLVTVISVKGDIGTNTPITLAILLAPKL